MEQELTQEIRRLRDTLKTLRLEKEKKLQEKRALSQKIVSLIQSSKALRLERDTLAEEVKRLKGERSHLNTQVSGKLLEVRAMTKESRDLQKKLGVKDPTKIKQHIRALHQKIETEVIPFEQEKKLMRVINNLEKEYGAAQTTHSIWEKAHDKKVDLEKDRQEANALHQQVQTLAEASQKKHEEIMQQRKQIDELKARQHQLRTELSTLFESFQTTSQRLEELLRQAVATQPKKPHVPRNQPLLEKQRRVREKLARGDKLTTEDILVIQTLDTSTP